jgi:hypothetical protein
MLRCSSVFRCWRSAPEQQLYKQVTYGEGIMDVLMRRCMVQVVVRYLSLRFGELRVGWCLNAVEYEAGADVMSIVETASRFATAGPSKQVFVGAQS